MDTIEEKEKEAKMNTKVLKKLGKEHLEIDNKEYKIFDSILKLYKIIFKIIPINSIQKI